MSFDFRYRRFSLRRLRHSEFVSRNAGRMLTFLAGGSVFFAFVELGPWVALVLIFGLILLAAPAILYGRKARNRNQTTVETSTGGLNWMEPAGIPFGHRQRMLNSTLVAANHAPVAPASAIRPRYFMDPLVAGRTEAGHMSARSGPEAFIGFTLRRSFEDALDRSRYEDAARIIAEMAETTDNQAWCVNASRRLAYRSSRPAEPAEMQH